MEIFIGEEAPTILGSEAKGPRPVATPLPCRSPRLYIYPLSHLIMVSDNLSSVLRVWRHAHRSMGQPKV
jgi:hypothetical protein